jgi:hypothetical protein
MWTFGKGLSSASVDELDLLFYVWVSIVVLGLFDWCTRRPAQDAVSMSLIKQRMPADVCGESVRQPEEVSYGNSISLCVRVRACMCDKALFTKSFHLENDFDLKNCWIPKSKPFGIGILCHAHRLACPECWNIKIIIIVVMCKLFCNLWSQHNQIWVMQEKVSFHFSKLIS